MSPTVRTGLWLQPHSQDQGHTKQCGHCTHCSLSPWQTMGRWGDPSVGYHRAPLQRTCSPTWVMHLVGSNGQMPDLVLTHIPDEGWVGDTSSWRRRHGEPRLATLPSLAQAKGKTCGTDMMGQEGTPKGDREQDVTEAELHSFSSWVQWVSSEKSEITLREHFCWDIRFGVGQGVVPSTRALGWGTTGLDPGPKTYQPIW